MLIDPFDRDNAKLIEKLTRTKRLAVLVILLERVTLALWRPALWVLFFSSLWLFQIPSIFGEIAAAATVAIFGGGLAFLLYADLRSLRWPSAQEINRRLEKDSKAPHRPLSSLNDDLANPEKQRTRNLWMQGRKQALKLLPRIKVAVPQAFMARKDPYALRLGVIMLFVLGLIIAGPNAKQRIWNGLTPVDIEYKRKMASGIALWITPPDYTRQGQIVLQGDENEKLSIPQGSMLKANLSGGLGQPVLHVDERRWPMTSGGKDSYILEMEMPEGQHLSIRQMLMTRAEWDFEIVHDSKPVIVLKGEAENLPDGPLRFPLMLYDDYGVQTLTMRMMLDEVVEDAPLGEAAMETRSVMSPASTEFEVAPVYDLTAHFWAGLPVVFTFEARDHIGQISIIPPVSMTLPERQFSHPVARQLIELRKKLIWNPEAEYKEIMSHLEALLRIPDTFQHDAVVFLSLRAAASRLYYNEPSVETARAAADLLWDTALRIEDGNLTLAARNLRDAQMALENALNNPNATDQEISQLMHELRQAMAEYLMELQKEMQKRMAEGGQMPAIPPEMLSHMVTPDGLAEFLDQLESQMLSGDRQSAQEMLSQLQRLMDMMDPSIARPMPPDMQMMQEGVNELQELIERQEELLEQTKTQARIFETIKALNKTYGEKLPQNKELLQDWGLTDVPPLPSPGQQNDSEPSEIAGISTQANKTEQEALRLVLGQLMLDAAEVLDEIPESMGLAEQEMRGSSARLDENRPDLSIPHQQKALDYLKDSQQQLTQQFMARMQQMTGMMFSSGMRYDPLGRPFGGDGDQKGLFPGSRVKIPNESERKRAQEILRILRERSGERDRPDEELDYYRRLLKQF